MELCVSKETAYFVIFSVFYSCK